MSLDFTTIALDFYEETKVLGGPGRSSEVLGGPGRALSFRECALHHGQETRRTFTMNLDDS